MSDKKRLAFLHLLHLFSSSQPPVADGLLLDLPERELVPRIAGDGEDEEGPEETVDEEKKRGPKTKRLSWSERLFRAADMAPHRNFAICKLSFRCLVVSSLSIDDAAEHLFDIKGQYGLPSPEWFQIICIVPDEEEVAAAAASAGEEEEEEEEEERDIEDEK